MFTYKNEYYLFIENTSQLNPTQIKIRNKFNIIYRNNNNNRENLTNLKKFRNLCTKSGVKFFIANKAIDMIKINADGLYISAYNKNLNLAKFKNSKRHFILTNTSLPKNRITCIKKTDNSQYKKERDTN